MVGDLPGAAVVLSYEADNQPGEQPMRRLKHRYAGWTP
jgi:hypothetical protein